MDESFLHCTIEIDYTSRLHKIILHILYKNSQFPVVGLVYTV